MSEKMLMREAARLLGLTSTTSEGLSRKVVRAVRHIEADSKETILSRIGEASQQRWVVDGEALRRARPDLFRNRLKPEEPRRQQQKAPRIDTKAIEAVVEAKIAAMLDALGLVSPEVVGEAIGRRLDAIEERLAELRVTDERLADEIGVLRRAVGLRRDVG